MQLAEPVRWTSDDGAEIGHVHLGEALVAQDAGIVDQDVDAAIFGFGFGDHGFDLIKIGDAGPVRQRGAARAADFRDDRGGGVAMAGAVARAAEIVDHHLGAAAGELERISAAEAAAGAGDDRGPAFE